MANPSLSPNPSPSPSPSPSSSPSPSPNPNQVRMDALLKIQADLLVSAVSAIEKDADKLRRDKEAGGMKAKK